MKSHWGKYPQEMLLSIFCICHDTCGLVPLKSYCTHILFIWIRSAKIVCSSLEYAPNFRERPFEGEDETQIHLG